MRQLGSSGNDSARDIAVDGTNNAFVVGSYNLEDGFIAKYDEAGNPLWTQQLNSPDTDELYGVTTDSLGDVYAVGSTHGSIEGHPNLGGKDAILVKYDGSGNLIWSKQFGTTAHDQLHKIISDNAGHFYSVGYTDGVMDGETDQGGANALLIKWDNEGNAIWTKQLKSETNASTIGWDLAYDEATGHVYITGYSPGSLDGETNAGSNDAFIAKYDSEGNLDWNRQLGTPEHDEAYAIALDADGNPYISGWTQGSLEGHTLNGEYDGFVAKYDPQGHLLWTEQYGTEGKDINHGINIDEHGQVTVTGYVGNSLDANIYNGGIDAALTGFDTNGDRSWSQQFGFGGSDYLKQVVSGNDGSFYTTGGINGQLESQTHAGSIDPFVAKYNHTQTYQQNTPLDLNGIYANDADLWDELTITLSLSDANAGTLTSNTSNNAITTFENGVLTVTGSANEVNAVLEDLQFNPATGYTETVTINTAVTDGTSDPVTGATITLESTKPPEFFAPDTPYLSFEDSPFKDETFTSFYLEDFEDGLLNTPGVTIDNGTTHPSEHKMDSVDGDDGSIDGSGSDGRSWWSWEDSLTVTFDESVLGSLPTHVGIVKTDSVEDLQFEAFDGNGNSLGVINKSGMPSILDQGVTSEDRFFGVVEKGGIASIKLTTKNFDPAVGWELDHLQYGF
ncbi:SBBP repeat-containing protein [Spirulina sp. CS-785/01]|uniref:SBBP repeat-containing protein n=1 Tax=Spirulina sp. CS-785/01 TaxID=3021716 RepID=UPI00232EAB11|nr:SBBP repeat-containing protein [Spirulina sp. CS-785/01]MDB9315365.1 SBBP repeat-containing protein [Spirulina sp. CS-785/01]